MLGEHNNNNNNNNNNKLKRVKKYKRIELLVPCTDGSCARGGVDAPAATRRTSPPRSRSPTA